MKKYSYLLMLVVTICLFTACGGATESSDANPTDPTGKQLVITASNFKFDANEYRIKKGEPINITLKNENGIHGIAIKDLDVNLDSSKKSVTITPDQAGTYEIHCSIMCGSGHSNMKSVLIVEE